VLWWCEGYEGVLRGVDSFWGMTTDSLYTVGCNVGSERTIRATGHRITSEASLVCLAASRR
jgi:hypothetical protein